MVTKRLQTNKKRKTKNKKIEGNEGDEGSGNLHVEGVESDGGCLLIDFQIDKRSTCLSMTKRGRRERRESEKGRKHEESEKRGQKKT